YLEGKGKNESDKQLLVRYSETPSLTESAFSAWGVPKDGLVHRYEWHPLTQLQIASLRARLNPAMISALLQRYFTTPSGIRYSEKIALTKAAEPLERYLQETFTDKLRGIHDFDLVPLAQFFAKTILTKLTTNGNSNKSHAHSLIGFRLCWT
ncbi:MAG: hypothetical protein ACREBC_33445, partial [Pyrinomonadaceae bacterium]